MTSLAHALTVLSASRPTPKERRRFRRLELGLDARFLDPAGREHECRTLDMSPGDAFLLSPAPVSVGQTIIAYIEHIGRIAGTVIRTAATGFAIVFDASPLKRERLAEALTALINDTRALLLEARRAKRYDGGGEVRLEFDDGGHMFAEIADFSLVGVGVRTAQPRPMIGTWVKVGAAHGRVSRYFEGGFAIDFETRPPTRS